MKYITTDKHDFLKKGWICEDGGGNIMEVGCCWLNGSNTLMCNKYAIDYWLKDGQIKELQEPEFTKDDMIEFAFWALSEQDNYEKETIKLDDWLEQRNK